MKKIPVFLSSDNNYSPFIATTVASTCANTKSFVEFYVLDDGITVENQEKIKSLKNQFDNFSIEFLKVDMDKYFEDIDHQWITKATYSRFLIPDLKPEIDRVLYSDVDIIVLGDIKEMFEEPLDGHIIGAIWDEAQIENVTKERKTRLNLSDGHKYFCAGNLVIDCKKWREQNITSKLFEIEKNQREIMKQFDQDVLNKFFDNNYKVLDNKYCWINQNYGVLKDRKIIIRHFNGSVKPWQVHPDIGEHSKLTFTYGLNEFWHYASMTPFYDELLNKTIYKTKADLQKFIVYILMRERQNARNG